MSDVKRWRDTDNLDKAIETAGGREAFDSAIGRMLDEAREEGRVPADAGTRPSERRRVSRSSR